MFLGQNWDKAKHNTRWIIGSFGCVALNQFLFGNFDKNLVVLWHASRREIIVNKANTST